VSRDEGQPTLREQAAARTAARLAEVAAHPLIQAALLAFPGAAIDKITEPDVAEALPLELPNEIKPLEDEAAPALYETDDPGPFGRSEAWDFDDEMGEEP